MKLLLLLFNKQKTFSNFFFYMITIKTNKIENNLKQKFSITMAHDGSSTLSVLLEPAEAAI